jgi:hypothetical protein
LPGPDFCFIFAPGGYDEPEILPPQNPSICLTRADGKQAHTAQLFNHFEERALTAMPANYLACAPGALFAGKKMLRYAGCVSGRRCPPAWTRRHPGVYRYSLGQHILQVRQCGDWRSRCWTVERIHWIDEALEALVFAVQHVPVWGRTRREAMFLAEYYSRPAALQLVGCCWKKVF